ncbi:MAG TPA: hypothetical protein VJU79_04420 [Candidatus Dormibacteraeota bacterium]|nr:hypothetical protein [Candidatus Dormibacteraeota bacterium]
MPDEPDTTDEDETEPEDDRPPDESTLLGAGGVESEVLAEAARAEAQLAGEDDDAEVDDEGAQV